MRNTTNFNLNIVEGSDKVNLITQMNPNTELIDEQMFKNQNAGVQTATELLTGTVHAITRSIPDASMIRFTAVSRFTAGDTFTVDSVQVSALLPSGEQLPDGAFIIGSEVLCVLKGTLLTVYASGGAVALAKDAEKLGGNLPSYYATKEEVDNAQNTANSAGAMSELNRQKIAILENKNMKLLWENNNPSADFPQQDITLTSDEYDFLLITCQLEGNLSTLRTVTKIVMKGFSYIEFSITGCESNNYPWTYQRNINRKSDKLFTISTGMTQRANSTSVGFSSDVLRPLTIYGGKF